MRMFIVLFLLSSSAFGLTKEYRLDGFGFANGYNADGFFTLTDGPTMQFALILVNGNQSYMATRPIPVAPDHITFGSLTLSFVPDTIFSGNQLIDVPDGTFVPLGPSSLNGVALTQGNLLAVVPEPSVWLAVILGLVWLYTRRSNS